MKGERPQTVFSCLVRHFARRMFASDEEQGPEGGMGLGLGVVLALLASPGAFASIFLLDKYSTLMQFLRGQKHFDPFRTSIGDEYFFVVLSMTITGLVMVMRWNRLFPDRRDFANLATLPIPIPLIFLANFAALFGMALIFALDVNGVSSLLFPLFVTLSDGSTTAFLQIALAHWSTLLLSSLFSFFSIFAFVGVLMLILPGRLFRAASLAARVVLVVALLTEFLSNLFLQLLVGRVPEHPEAYMRLLPSFWFLALYERSIGVATPAMARLAQQAVYMLLLAIGTAALTYTICYRRHFARLAESPSEMLGSTRHSFRLPMPAWLERVIYRSPFEYAVFSFTWKALTRSERHLLFFGGYLGMGLVMVVSSRFDVEFGTGLPSTALLSIPLLIGFFTFTGLRAVFDMPATPDANWIFRLVTLDAAPETLHPPPESIGRKMLLLSALPWQLLLWLPFLSVRYGFRVAALQTATLVALTFLFSYGLCIQFQKIPFTCTKDPEMRSLLLKALACVLAVLGIPLVAGLQRWSLQQPIRFAVFLILISLAWSYLKHFKAGLGDKPPIQFEDRATPQFEFLKLV